MLRSSDSTINSPLLTPYLTCNELVPIFTDLMSESMEQEVGTSVDDTDRLRKVTVNLNDTRFEAKAPHSKNVTTTTIKCKIALKKIESVGVHVNALKQKKKT